MAFPAGPDDIDAAWLSAALAPSMPVGTRVRAVAASRIGVGYGLSGVVARVQFEGDDVPPWSIVAKWSDAGIARPESRFYADVAPRLEIRLPKLLGSFEDAVSARSLLLMEDISPARQGDCLLGLALADAAALAEAEAAIHATWWSRPDAPEIAFAPLWADATPREPERTAERLPLFIERYRDRLAASVLRTFEHLPESIQDARTELARAPITLVHGDLHADNVLFCADGSPVILDWTHVSRGPAALDFTRLLVECLSVPVRRAEEGRLAAAYVAALAQRGVVGYDIDRLWHDTTTAALVTAGWVMRWAGNAGDPSDGVPRAALIIDGLVANMAALLEDLARRGGDRRPRPLA